MVKRSSRLTNSVHSWANDVPDIANTRADDMSSIRRMIDSPRPRPDSVPELHGRLQCIALDQGRIGDAHLQIALAGGRGAPSGRFVQVGKGGAHDAGAHSAPDCADDRFTPAAGGEPDIWRIAEIASRVSSDQS